MQSHTKSPKKARSTQTSQRRTHANRRPPPPGYLEFKYDDLARFPSGKLVSLRDEKVDSHFGQTTATLSLDVTVTWE